MGKTIRQATETAKAVPLFISAPLFRRWHLRWGVTDKVVHGRMPGDELVQVSHFTATRAITIGADPELVWPWLVQVGFNRAAFYSYDRLDSLGKPSAERTCLSGSTPALETLQHR